MKFFWIDCEMTGKDPVKNGIHQIAGIVEIDGVVQEMFNYHVNTFPGDEYNDESFPFHGKTREEIATYPSPTLIYYKIKLLLNRYVDLALDYPERFIIAGHKVNFDFDFMKAWFQKNLDPTWEKYFEHHQEDIVCHSILAGREGMLKVPDYRLETIAKAFGIPHTPHDAFSDIRATYEIFNRYGRVMRSISREALVNP